MMYLGIDPGVNGGIAIIDDKGTPVAAFKMPSSERELLDKLQTFGPLTGAEGRFSAKAVIERVSASPQMGVVSAFTFGKGYGRLLMALTCARIPFSEVTPQTWQKALSCRTGGVKNISKRRAEQLFPDLTVTHAIADALLLAEFCRRAERGDIRQTNAPHDRRETDGQEKVEPQTVGGEGGQEQTRGESREEFERDRHGETGERLAARRRTKTP